MCTNFRLKAKDGSVVIGRSQEYALEVSWDLQVVPRGVPGQSLATDGPGRSWTGAHGYVGIGIGRSRVLGVDVPEMTVNDGVNDAGLYVAAQYLPGYTQYEPVEGVDAACLLSPMDMVAFVLATAGSVADAVAAIESVVVWAVPLPVIGVVPLHLIVHDRGGASVVIEWVGGVRHVHDNVLGVCTNSPTFDWHLANMRQYVNLGATDAPETTLNGQAFSQIGQGSGLLGIPGDYTPPSRFVRTAFLAAHADPAADSLGSVNVALHVLNSVDITKGTVIAPNPEGIQTDVRAGDFTDWVTVAELGATLAYTVRTYQDPVPQRLELSSVNLAGGPATRFSLNAPGGPVPMVLPGLPA